MLEVTSAVSSESANSTVSTAACPICQDRAGLVRSFSQRGAERTSLFRCSRCAAGFLHPQPSNEWLAAEYENYYGRRQAPGGKSENFRTFFERFDPRGFASILEVGGGEGDCARELKKAAPQSQLTVVESNPDCHPFFAGIDCELHVKWLEAWLETPSERKYDLILCFDVLEHLREPENVLLALSARMQPQARIWATFPNFDSLSRRWLGSLWPQYKDEHLFYFSRQSVERLCAAADLSIVSLTPHVKRLSIGYLLAVGSGFGPLPLKWFFRFLKLLTPGFIQAKMISLRLGEWLLIARQNGVNG